MNEKKIPWTSPFSRYALVEKEIDLFLNKAYPLKNFTRIYLPTAESDLRHLLKIVFENSRPFDPRVKPSCLLSFGANNGLQVDAYAFLETEKLARFNISLGTLFALDDLFFRLCCNKEFFSFDLLSENFLWYGCQSVWFETGNLQPHTRYYDYRQLVIFGGAKIDESSNLHLGTSLTGFLNGIPLDDTRTHLASVMVYIAILWIMMHEEGHYSEGHLHYLQESRHRKQRENLRLDEVAKNPKQDEANKLHKVFEWQADRHAIYAVIDIMFREDMLVLLPAYCRRDPGWLLRLIMTAIGALILVFQKARQFYGSPESYPSPRTRIVIMILGCFARIASLESGLRIPSNFLENKDKFSATIGALHDLFIASELLPRKEDLADFGTGFYPMPHSPQTLDFIQDEEEFGAVIDEIFHPRHFVAGGRRLVEAETSSNKTREKWMRELNELIEYHDREVYQLLGRFRKRAVA
jgi:hypothetical protein